MTDRNPTLAFLLGAAAGGLAAVLLAPDRGSRTRRRLREGAEHVLQQGTEKYEETRDAAREKAEDVADAVTHRKDAVKAAVREGKQAYREELEAEA
ncbi:MAG TPA: YtxH domain-containing protein [Candidatus Krumholzibacteria bacterium]|nr:YtxH domain-containing protein [Candidatus Krumholzibacteria bacterium]HRX52345.1 YtxH domain-containing protein [Candidatus Krumholzibacteria bacterium]